MLSRYKVHIRKDALKFSSAHMTVFADGTKEALHGHNYRAEVTIHTDSATLEQMVSFGSVKKAMGAICDEWDEKVLLAGKCRYMKGLTRKGGSIQFSLCGRRYLLPEDETVLLPLENVTTELLAEEFCMRFVKALGPQARREEIRAIEVRIEEITGQGASYTWIHERR